jgi:hypothetical protein
MKTFKRLLILPLLLALSGCVVVSIFPFYEEGDLVATPELVGRWVKVNPDGKENEKETLEFKKWGEKGLWLRSADENGKAQFSAEVHTFRLKDTLLLDMAVAATQENGDQIIRPHFLFKVTQTAPTLKWALLSEDWVKKILEKDPEAIRHHFNKKEDGTSDDDLILTAQSKNLREFLLKHLPDATAFNDVDEYRRAKQ